ncbi:MAG: hypothetical protein HDP34_02935 [Clostridia bacterium]|nr:hypothetical protein [Clostridia bacterium]
MNSKFEEIYYNYLERNNVERSKEFLKLKDEEYKIYEKLNKEQKNIFNKIFDIHSDMMAEVELSYFKEGFKLGLVTAMEAVFS